MKSSPSTSKRHSGYSYAPDGSRAEPGLQALSNSVLNTRDESGQGAGSVAPLPAGLNPRQTQLLILIIAGNSLKESAAVCGVSKQAVKNQMRFIREKLACRTTEQAIAICFRQGILK